MKSAVRVIEAEFSMPFVSHACMEPVSCAARVHGDQVELWLSTKSPTLDACHAMFSIVGSAYRIPNEAGTYVNVPLPVCIGAFRGNNDTHNGFMLETMIDEAAHATGADPLEYRRRLLSKDARSIAVLDRAAAIAGWGKVATGHHQGIAYLQSEFYRCRLAVIVEVSGTADALKVERLVGVCDSGLAVNPLLAERVVEAGMIFGLSNAMSERITLAGGAPEQPISIRIRFFVSTRRPTSASRSSRLATSRAVSARLGRCRWAQRWATPSSQRPASAFAPSPSQPMVSPSSEGPKSAVRSDSSDWNGT
jgi:CO/xanthine dehydrogenase Mo-binding subunit